MHAWDQSRVTATDTTSAYISELGTVVDKTGTYVRKTTNIAVYGQRRGVSFKQQLAVPAGGMPWDSATTGDPERADPDGPRPPEDHFPGAVDQLRRHREQRVRPLRRQCVRPACRSQLNLSPDTGVNFSPYLTSSPDTFVKAFNSAITTIADAVGEPPSVVYSRYAELAQLSNQQLSIQRTMDETEFVPGVMVPAIMTTAGKLPIVGIPGDAIGHYTATTYSGYDVADMYAMNEQQLAVPYLGNPGPSVIEIPPGVSGQLSRLYIVWGMFGLRVSSALHSSTPGRAAHQLGIA